MESNQRDPQNESIIGRDANQPQADNGPNFKAEAQAISPQQVEQGNLEVEFESEIPEEGGEA